MEWTNERYVRLYTRDTDDWLVLSWQAKALFPLILRKVDRSGFLSTKRGPVGIAAQTGVPIDVVTIGLLDLLRDGSVTECDGGYLLPNYIDAQEAPQSDAQRQKEHRERLRDRKRSHNVTGESQNVGKPSLQPSQPSQPNQPSNLAVALRSAAAESREDLLSLGAIDLAVAANLAITAKFGEQTNPLQASNGKTHSLTEIVVNADIPIDFAIRSIERQVSRSEKVISTMWYFRQGILDDWSKHIDAASSASQRSTPNGRVIPIRPASSPVAAENDGVVCPHCRTKETELKGNKRYGPKHKEGCPALTIGTGGQTA